MPPMSTKNGLDIVDLKDSNGNKIELSELEATLIAKNILFMKIFHLPKSRWSAVKDKTVNVPIQDDAVLQTVSNFPRMPSEAGIIPVKLKRKTTYKQHHVQQYIRPNVLQEALTALKTTGKPHYQFVTTNENYEETCKTLDPEGYELMNDSSLCMFEMLESPVAANQDDQLHAEEEEKDNDADEDELDYIKNDAVRKWQYTQDDNVLMDNMFPENQINVHADDSSEIANIENEGVSVAPGEGQMPTNILAEKDWDVKTFPHLFPNGKYGLHYSREQKLTNLQYFNQRLLNKDLRYSSSPCFVYAASTYIEKQQLERNINISYTRGTRRSTDEGNTIFNLEDSFAVLDKISNTPKYWQQAKNELIAKLENLGPFQFFFTLSCAEKRWLENMAVILKNSLGDKLISYKYREQIESDAEDSNETQPEVELLIDGMRMDVYFEHNNIQINIHDEMRKNVLTLTRHFDHRVKMFMKNIVMGDNNPMNVQYFNYRIEFQARGAGHTHGVLWLDLEAVERDLEGNKIYQINNQGISVPKLIFPGVKEAMTKIKNDEILTDEDIENLVKFVDAFVTVDLDDPDVKGIVNEVNTHHHTKACRKKGTTCRFNYPRLPSTETVIAKPYIHMDIVDKTGEQVSDEEKRKIFQKLNAKLEKIKKKLEDDDLMKVLERLSSEEQILELCKKCKVSVEDYTKALKYSYGRYSITYKRNLQERYVNCYNKEWIKAWNGNMDIQVCLDYFAVITYVTDYVCKDDNTLTQVLLEAAKHCKSETARNRMKTIKDTFLTHRQMGEAEVYYRIFPELHLKDSNVKTVFLPTGFPENRTHFMQKVNIENMHQYTEDELVTIDGKDSKYVAKPSAIDKYMRRPGGLEHMCLMQIVKMYDSVSSVPKNVKWRDGCSFGDKGQATETEDIEHHINRHKDFHKILILPENKCEMSVEEYSSLLLPKYISLSDPKPGEPCYLRLRSFPLVVRLHKFNRTKERHEYLYSEILQYHAFRNEEELCRNDEKQCAELYCETVNGEGITKVVKLKSILMEHQESVLEGKSKAEAILSDAVGEQLDPELEQELQDGELEGISEHPEYQVLIPPDSIERGTSTGDSYYCPIQLNSVDELYKQTHKLDKEQMLVLEEGVRFAKSVVKFMSGSTACPRPPRIIVQGGAGSGKSTVISTLVQWMEKIFRKEGDNPEHPYILVCAPTGTAAAVVHGQTLHHSFSFNFGNEYMSLSDKARDQKRSLLRNLKVVIIDEISMVKADLLYQLDLRLREVMERPSEVFGGIAIFCFGDLLQLKPVKAPYVFEQPKCKNYAVTHALEPLWRMFRPMNLNQNHRQGNDKTYADILNRIRTGNVTDADCNQLEERVRDINHQDIPSDAMYVTCTNARVKEINDAKLDNLQTEQAVLPALNINATCKEFCPPIGKAGNVHTTPFMNKLTLKVKARVMLVFNCDTNDGLTNGAMGEVLGFQKSKKGEVICVIVHFIMPQLDKKEGKGFPNCKTNILTIDPHQLVALNSLTASQRSHILHLHK